MTSKPDFPIPEWRKAWKLDDPEWVKARRQAWRRIKQSPLFEMFEKRELKRIKNFFMTGSAFDPEPPEEEWRWYRYHPDKRPVPVSNSVLIECWLGADQSETHWQEIKTKYSEGKYESSRRFFRQCLRNRFPFDGLDERLYYFFEPTRCRPEDYPGLSHEQYLARARQAYGFSVRLIKRFLLSDKPNEDDIAPCMAPEFCDSIAPNYECLIDRDGEQKVQEYAIRAAAWLSEVFEMAREQKPSTSKQLTLAQEIAEGLKGLKFPDAVMKNFEPYVEGL
jgi:hypothetical protein